MMKPFAQSIAWGLLTLAGAAAGQITEREIAGRALGALKDNAAKYKDVLYRVEASGEFGGSAGFCIDGECPERHIPIPVVRSHLEIVNGRSVLVWDGWDDLPAAPASSGGPRMAGDGNGSFGALRYAQEFAGSAREFILIGMKHEKGRLVYVLESSAARSANYRVGSVEACASAQRATLYIDKETFFPIRIEQEVVKPNMCSAPGVADNLNQVGTKAVVTMMHGAGKDSCGEEHFVYVPSRAETTSASPGSGTAVLYKGQPVERLFNIGAFTGRGTFTIVSELHDFRIFVTCVSISFAPVEPVELVESSITFGEVVPDRR